jgi:DNA-directed RNA polymerase subunit RPC12/RpoP
MLTMRQLMDDPIYRAYMKKVPPVDGFNPNPAWQIWVEEDNRRWLTATFATYAEVWPVFVKRYRYKMGDPTITSRRTFYAPPGEWYKVRVKLSTPRVSPSGVKTTHRIEDRWRQTFHWNDYRAEWCGRCRRPVEFRPLFETHHALKRFPVISDEDNIRCPICGIRRSAQPSHDLMVRLT